MPEFECRQIFFAHRNLWEAMEAFAARNNLRLDLIPHMREDGVLTLEYPEDVTPTYAFMPRMPGDK